MNSQGLEDSLAVYRCEAVNAPGGESRCWNATANLYDFGGSVC